MSDDDVLQSLTDLGVKLDTVAGAVATIAGGHTDLLSHVAEAEARRGQDSVGVAQRLDALERQVLAVGQRLTELLDRQPDGLPIPPPPPPPPPPGAELEIPEIQLPEIVVPDEVTAPPTGETDLVPVQGQLAALVSSAERHHDDLALTLEVLARVAEAIERLDARTEDRLASVRDAAMAPVADLEALLTARTERTEARFDELASLLHDLAERDPDASPGPGAASEATTSSSLGPVLERIEELVTGMQSLTWQLPELGEDVTGRLTEHTDTALAGILRLIDDRLVALRRSLGGDDLGGPPQAAIGGFEAGAVMGAAQAAWNRLEQRLDTEFDDLGRQLQAMASLIEGVVSSTEGLANRPVVTGDQLRKAATSVRDSVVNASRSRRDRRGGPRGLGSG